MKKYAFVTIVMSTLAVCLSSCCREPLLPEAPGLASTTMWVTDHSSSVDQMNYLHRTVRFTLSKKPDQSTINAQTVLVEGMAGLFILPDSTGLRIDGIATNYSIVGDFPVCTLKVRLVGMGDISILDLEGFPLDGDHDNVQGGDYEDTIIY